MAGRPSLYREEYCDLVEEKMGEGFSMTAVAGIIGVSRESLNTWSREYPEFQAAVERAKSKRVLHWETEGLDIAKNGGSGSRATMVTFGLRNMGTEDWQDVSKNEHSGPNGGPIATVTTSARELLASKLNRLLPTPEAKEEIEGS